MSKINKDLQVFYDKIDYIRESLEFENKKKLLDELDTAMDSLNRYLSVVEKFDRTGKKRTE